MASAYIAHNIDSELASGVSSFGYNLLVGLNIETSGQYSSEIMNFLGETQAQTGSATEAHSACLKKAVEKMGTQSIIDTLNLFAKKFEMLWGNDNYGVEWNLRFADPQSDASFRSIFASAMYLVSNFYYLTALAFSTFVFFKLRKCGLDATYPIMLLFLGIMGLHLFVESQNRYHYSALNLLAILCGLGVSYMIKRNSIPKNST